MKVVFSPGPSYSSEETRKYAGWIRILDLYKEGLEELGHEVFVPKVDPSLIDQSSTVSKILSYDLVAAQQIPGGAELFLGPPGYSVVQMMAGRDNNWGQGMRPFLYVWNGQDWWRDQQLAEEYKKFNSPYDLSPSWRWVNRTALEMCVELGGHVIACSPWVKKTHAKIVPEDKISIAFWGVDSEKFHPPQVDPPGFNVLFVGGDPIRKGLAYLAKAMEGLEGAELWLVGCTFPWEDHNELKIREFGMVPHAEVANIMRQCHVCCIPTLEDGIALAIQESMACGLVPVTSPETAEVFENNVSGFKVGYRKVDEIRYALWVLKQNPNLRRQMGAGARKLAEKQTWTETKRQFKEIIKKEMGT